MLRFKTQSQISSFWTRSMRWSQVFIPTLREDPAEAEVVSHKLLLRTDYIRQLVAGVYSYLFLAQRSLGRIVRIVAEEMDGIGGQQMLLPMLHPPSPGGSPAAGTSWARYVPAEGPQRAPTSAWA